MSRSRVLLSILLTVLFLAADMHTTQDDAAQAAGPCGFGGNYYNGYGHNRTGYPSYDFEGASAYIVVRDGGLMWWRV